MLTSAPNLLTIGRIAVIPLLVLCFYFPGEFPRYLACTLFTAAAITDYLDGYLARSWRQQSPFGRWLDPIADKLLVAAAILMLVGLDRAPLLPSLVILLREITVSGLREYMAEVSVGLPVSRLAKWKTAVQMVAIGVLIVGDAGPGLLPGARDRRAGPLGRRGPYAGHRLRLPPGRGAARAGGAPAGPAPADHGGPRDRAGLRGTAMRIRYFAWLKQRTGRSEEELDPPPGVATVQALMDHLAGRYPRFAEALAAPGVVRCAVNQEYAEPATPVRPGDEVAFFPPVTGG